MCRWHDFNRQFVNLGGGVSRVGVREPIAGSCHQLTTNNGYFQKFTYKMIDAVKYTTNLTAIRSIHETAVDGPSGRHTNQIDVQRIGAKLCQVGRCFTHNS